MRNPIPEFTFAFALVNEMLSVDVTIGAPYFPTTVREAELGYDVRIPFLGRALFLQFKVPDRMVRSSASGWERFMGPHYRMYLRTRPPNQHELLYRLEGRGNSVEYAAIGLHTLEDFHAAFQRRQIRSATAFFRPSEIGRLDGSTNHFVSFQHAAAGWWVFSEPEYRAGDPSFERLAERLRREADLSTEITRLGLASSMVDVYATVLDLDRETRLALNRSLADVEESRRDDIASWFSRTLFGTELLFLIPPGTEPRAGGS